MNVDLKFAIRKLLSRSPMHGYMIKKSLSDIFVKETSSGALYPALKELEDSGEIVFKDTVEHGKFKKIYTLTDRGRKALKESEQRLMKLLQFSGAEQTGTIKEKEFA